MYDAICTNIATFTGNHEFGQKPSLFAKKIFLDGFYHGKKYYYHTEKLAAKQNYGLYSVSLTIDLCMRR